MSSFIEKPPATDKKAYGKWYRSQPGYKEKQKERTAAWAKKNKERIRENWNRWLASNKKHREKTVAKWRLKNKERISLKNKQKYLRNKAILEAYKKNLLVLPYSQKNFKAGDDRCL